MEAQLERTVENFMNVTAKSTVAVVVPLYGFWNDIPNNPVNGQALALTLQRMYSNVHYLYFIFVAHPGSLPNDPKDPKSVGNILRKMGEAGNTKNIPVDRDATYAEYVREGMDCAINETKAQFIVVFNPWTMIQHGSLDELIDRCNRADDAKIVSGFDLRSVIEGEQFDSYKTYAPSEDWDLTFNLVAMPRFAAEGINLDPEYKTHAFLERDVWQQGAGMNYAVIATQRIPIFPFDFPWQDYETREAFESDKAHFAAKWRFDPGINYLDTRGANRKDKGYVKEA